MEAHGLYPRDKIQRNIAHSGLFEIEPSMLEQIGVVHSRYITRYDLDEALSYLEDDAKTIASSTGEDAQTLENTNV